MNSMTLVTIDGCEKCNKAKEFIKYSGKEATIVSCEKYPYICDKIELATGTSTYPMLMLYGKTHYSPTELYFVAESYENLKPQDSTNNHYILKPHMTLEQMIESIKQKI